jgi:uncharacterized protein (DUF849 family)
VPADLLIKACLNGSQPAGSHPRLPVSAHELARDAVAVSTAGAGAVHVHVRDGAGRETLDPELVDDCVRVIRRACPTLPIGVSTGAWIEPDPSRRAALAARWTEPNFASVNLSEPGHAEVMTALLDAGIAVEAGVFTPGDVRRLTLTGLSDDVVRVLIEPGSGAGDVPDQVALAAAIERALDAAAIRAPRLHHGNGAQTWSVLRAAVARRRDVRIGLEDTLVGVDGRPAASNAALVRMARKIVDDQAAL